MNAFVHVYVRVLSGHVIQTLKLQCQPNTHVTAFLQYVLHVLVRTAGKPHIVSRTDAGR
jgi:hypothetical protein